MTPQQQATRRRVFRVFAAVFSSLLLVAGFFAGKSWLDGRAPADSSGRAGLALVAVGDRTEPIDLSGETLEGEVLDVADWRGQVVVVNVWGSWCGPCREEAPDLVEVYESTRTLPVQFVGIDVRDGRSSALAFQRRYGIRYPSFFDEEGRLLLAFSGSVPVGAVPSTVLLDREGRIAASNAGVIDAVTLRGVIDDVLAEKTTDAVPLGLAGTDLAVTYRSRGFQSKSRRGRGCSVRNARSRHSASVSRHRDQSPNWAPSRAGGAWCR